MKRVVVLILIASLALSLTACPEQVESEESISLSPASQADTAGESANPSEETKNAASEVEKITSEMQPSETELSVTDSVTDEPTYPSEEETVPETTTTQETVPQISSSVLITELTSIDRTPVVTDRLVDNWGNSYDYAVTNKIGYTGDSDEFRYEYLNTGFSTFTGTLYIPEGETSDYTTALIIKGDGYTLYTSPGMTKTSQPVEICVDISGFSDIVFEWINNSTYSNFSDLTGCLADPCFNIVTNTDNAGSSAYLPISILDLDSLESKLSRSNLLVDNRGNLYPIALFNKVDNYHGNAIPSYRFLLDNKFDRFTGTIYIPQGSNYSSPVSMIIRADGIEIYESPEMTASSEPVEFDIDVIGCEILEITYTERAWAAALSEHYLGLAYPYLYEGEGIGNELRSIRRYFYTDTEVEYNWGFELFDRDSMDPSYDLDLGRSALYLCEGTYKGQNVAESRMRSLGFGDIQSQYYEVDNVLNTSPITVGSVVTDFGGEEYLIVAVTIRGTGELEWDDIFTDLRSGLLNVDGFSEAGDIGKDVVREYCTSRCEKYHIDMEHTILFVTGHSLGATIAGQIAGDLENEVALRQHIFGYTFASPYYDTKGKNTADYTNIHNLINVMDDFPDFPLGGMRYGIDHIFLGNGQNLLDQHSLQVYLSGIHAVEEEQKLDG